MRDQTGSHLLHDPRFDCAISGKKRTAASGIGEKRRQVGEQRAIGGELAFMFSLEEIYIMANEREHPAPTKHISVARRDQAHSLLSDVELKDYSKQINMSTNIFNILFIFIMNINININNIQFAS